MSELKKIDTVVGEGKEAAAGNHVDVHYTGWLFDENASDNKGQKFDSSLDRGQLFSFPLGAGHVIKGWDEGVAGMKIGGKQTHSHHSIRNGLWSAWRWWRYPSKCNSGI